MFTKRQILIALKILVSALLVGLLLSNIGWDELIGNLRQMDKELLVLSFFVIVLQFPIKTFKWSRALIQHDLRYRFWYLNTVSCIGYFFNNFLPTGIGGDAYRILKTLPALGRKSRAVSAALLDRVLGILASLIMGYIAAVLLSFGEHDVPGLQIAVIASSTAGIVAIAVLFAGIKFELLKRIERIPKIGSKIHPLTENIRLIARPNSNFLVLLFLSFAFQISAIVLMAILFEAADYSVSLIHCAIIVAVGAVAIMLPISIAGIGVYEGAIVGSAVALGLPGEPALAAAVMLRVLTIPMSIICGLIYIGSNLRPTWVDQARQDI